MKKYYSYHIQVKPNAKINKILGYQANRLKIAIKAAPVDGKANQALIDFLASYLDLPKSCIEITKGETSLFKQIIIYSDIDHLKNEIG